MSPQKFQSEPEPCPFCTVPALQARADDLVEQGLGDRVIANTCGVTLAQWLHHSEHCAARRAERDARAVELPVQRAAPRPLDRQDSSESLDGQAIISRLNAYLVRAEEIIEAVDVSDTRGALLALDQARKTCETMSKLYLDIMKAQLDASVQAEFRRIVMEAINATSPDVRERIVAEIQSRAAVFGVLGGAGL